MDWYITPIQNEGGEIYQYLAVQKEVTQLVITEKSLEMASEVVKRRSRELEKTNRKLNQLLAEQQKTMSLFSKYVPEPIVKASLDKTTEKQRMSRALETVLLFCDIRSFTALIEGLNPDEVFDLLNIYYANMSEVIRRYDGVIIQFVGDEIFVAFGAPLPIENPKLRAVHCAVEMIHCLRDINGDLEKKFKREMTVGIGINYGSVMAGSLGSEDKLSYSITGSEVITAKRIESLTRGLKNAILISESVYQDVKDTMQARAWGKVDIKGQNQKVNVYQVMELI